jgi:molybdopterin/thiamine biosynthesis adenylyltransferase
VKVLITDGAVAVGRAVSHAGILGLQGQTLTVLPGRSACLRCLFPEPPLPDTVPTCQEAGILGAVAGVIGSVQANEVIKYLLGNGTLLTNRLLTFDGLAQRWRGISVTTSAHCPLERCRDRVEPAREHAHP